MSLITSESHIGTLRRELTELFSTSCGDPEMVKAGVPKLVGISLMDAYFRVYSELFPNLKRRGKK